MMLNTVNPCKSLVFRRTQMSRRCSHVFMTAKKNWMHLVALRVAGIFLFPVDDVFWRFSAQQLHQLIIVSGLPAGALQICFWPRFPESFAARRRSSFLQSAAAAGRFQVTPGQLVLRPVREMEHCNCSLHLGAVLVIYVLDALLLSTRWQWSSLVRFKLRTEQRQE